MFRDHLKKIIEGVHLDENQMADVMTEIFSGSLTDAQIGAFMGALATKGETEQELAGAARAMRRKAHRIQSSAATIVDTCGTGGDGASTFNISTTTAFVVAGCDITVAKHGNRAVSSSCGSADVLEELGMGLPLDEQTAVRCLNATGFSFLFAPYYHPAMKSVAAVRGALGVRTVFNVLGPLTNPAEPPFGLIGAYSPDMAELMAEALSGTNMERVYVVHGDPGWDEATPVGPFQLFDVTPGRVERLVRDPLEWGLERCRPEDLAGGDAEHNAARLRAVFSGEEAGAHRDALILGAALVLELTGKAQDPAEAVSLAVEALDSGKATELLDAIARFAGSEGRR